AGLWDSGRRKVVTVGRFDTAEEAAGAYDAAAVGMYGAAARTNFDQKPTAAAAKTNFEQQPTAAAADGWDGSSVDLLSDFPELPACNVRSDSIIPGPALDDLRTDADLTPAERQQVDEFLIDMDFANVVD
uniref:AP2/ERF domain-containing protein n=1 Tax=Aegilops tauschii subsp. strangulata TaxID=200361 RepID=A0A453NDL0_AEGTS